MLILSLITTGSFAASTAIKHENIKSAKMVVMEVTYEESYSKESLSMYFNSIKEAEDFYIANILVDDISDFCHVTITSSYTNPTTGETCSATRKRVLCSEVETVVTQLRALAYFLCTAFQENQ